MSLRAALLKVGAPDTRGAVAASELRNLKRQSYVQPLRFKVYRIADNAARQIPRRIGRSMWALAAAKA